MDGTGHTYLISCVIDNCNVAYSNHCEDGSIINNYYCIIRNGTQTSSNPSIRIYRTTTSVFNYSLIYNNTSNSGLLAGVTVTGTYTPNLIFNNCNFYGNDYGLLYAGGSTNPGTVTCNNCMFFGNCASYAGNPFSTASGGTITLNNCNIEPPFYLPGLLNLSATGITTNNCISSLPAITRNRYTQTMEMSLIIDDLAALEQWLNLTTFADTYNQKLTIALNGPNTLSASDWTALAGAIARGHDVAVHTMSHGDLGQLNAINIQYTGSGSACAMTITTANGIATNLSTVCTGAPEDNLNITLNPNSTQITDGSSIGSTITAINATGKYTASLYSHVVNALPITANSAPGCLAAVSGQDIKTAYTAIFDSTAYYAYEVSRCQYLINHGIQTASGATGRALTYKTTTLVYPSNNRSSASDIAIQGLGITMARAGSQATHNSGASLNIFDCWAVGTSTAAAGWGTDAGAQATFNKNCNAIASYLGFFGGPLVIWGHGTTIDANQTEAWYQKLIVGLTQAGITLISFNDLSTYLHANWSDSGDHITYTRSWSDSTNFALLSSSPAINAGSNAVWSGTASVTSYNGIGITNAAGAIIAPGGTVDIGAYEYRPSINNAARFLLLFD